MVSGTRPLSNQASRLAAAINDAVETLVERRNVWQHGHTLVRPQTRSSGNGSVQDVERRMIERARVETGQQGLLSTMAPRAKLISAAPVFHLREPLRVEQA